MTVGVIIRYDLAGALENINMIVYNNNPFIPGCMEQSGRKGLIIYPGTQYHKYYVNFTHNV